MRTALTHYGLAGVVFQFFLLTFVASEVAYVITASSWPPARWFQLKVRHQYGTADQSAMSDFWSCPYCAGGFLTILVFAWAGYLLSVPLLYLQMVAAMRIVGLVGSRFD